MSIFKLFQKWLKNLDQRQHNDYIWKFVLPETLTKIYMAFFKIDHEEATKRNKA